ncbi:MAG: C-terminal binding protein [Anaerolineae bacterium]
MSPQFKVVITDHYFPTVDPEREILKEIDAEVVELGTRDPETIIAAARDADAVIVGHALFTPELIAQLERCRVIVRYGVGFDNVDLDAATAHGIYVCNVPDYCTDDVATHAIMLALACLRRLPHQMQVARTDNWKAGVTGDVPRLAGLTFGILGLGRIGSAAARKARGLGCQVIACDPYIEPEQFAAVDATPVTFEELLARSDILSLHTPLTPETRGLFDEETLRKMKPSAILVNTARGPIVRNAALVRALREGWIAGAGLDVLEQEPAPPDEPLLHEPHAIVTPHIAWYSETAKLELQKRAAQEVVRVLTGEGPRNLVNPEVVGRARATRQTSHP